MNEVAKLFCQMIFQGVSQTVVDGALSADEATTLARIFVAEEFPDAVCAIIYGSAVEGGFGPYSDIDLVIFLPQIAFAETRRLIYQGVPLELHLFSKETFARALEMARISGNYNQALSLAHATLLFDPVGTGDRVIGAAQRVLERGPSPVPEHMRSAACCSVTSYIIELATNPDASERFSIAASLQPLLMASYLSARGRWVNSRKWGVRAEPLFAEALTLAIDAAYRNQDVTALIAQATLSLEPWGGLRWSGTGARLWLARPGS
jgi:Nucleotidyltransferase domain